MKTPNIFNYATSELSQDAFICWLLAWSDPTHANEDKDLHLVANHFVKSLFEKHQIELDAVETIKIKPQDQYIDVGAIVNDQYYLLIEDKTVTRNHSNQLNKYYQYAFKKYVDTGKLKNIIPIYLKTHDQCDMDYVREHNGFEPYLRKDFLGVLNGYGGNNCIMLAFKSYLQSIEDNVNAFSTRPLVAWRAEQWIGFFQALKNEFPAGQWKYVPNPSGGFYGFWWAERKTDEPCPIKLQVEGTAAKKQQPSIGKLCFKIKAIEDTLRKKLRSQWRHELERKFENSGFSVVKPQRFGNGKFMTAAILQDDFRVAKPDGTLDFDATVASLKKIEEIYAL
ncbi:PD-(D/E)XK nuclease family protein [Thiomicrorhabdus cannonii]|uniref:PD-(D/E)XK nuclease family protein n=1 Tax=Thiomicrorhabdus cannonii TaxID=2748011 RepID=UPI0015BBDB37|nr:PD-(D/E)XK nuclease family protein [Thiomicrorhabdus cannonii]